MNERKKEAAKRPAKGPRKLRNQLEKTIDRTLRETGLKEEIMGYQYLIDSVAIAVKNVRKLDALTKALYPEVATRNKTTSSRVERSIRHAIDIMWKNGNMEKIGELFGYTAEHTSKRPTNSEIIAVISDRVRLQYKQR